MLLIGLLALGAAWAFVVAVVVGVCVSAARGDLLPSAVSGASAPVRTDASRHAPLRLAV